MNSTAIIIVTVMSFFFVMVAGLGFGVWLAKRKKKNKQRLADLEAQVAELTRQVNLDANLSIQEFMNLKFKNLSKQEQVSLLLNYIAQLQTQGDN